MPSSAGKCYHRRLVPSVLSAVATRKPTGISIYYAVYGQGSPAVRLHGGLANADYWRNQVKALITYHTVIVMDSRGHGRSTRNSQPYGYDLMADDVVALMDFLKVRKSDIVEWSDGGILGIDLAMCYLERVGRIFAFGCQHDDLRPSGMASRKVQHLLFTLRGRAMNTRSIPPPQRNTKPLSQKLAGCGQLNRTGPMRNLGLSRFEAALGHCSRAEQHNAAAGDPVS